MNLFCLPYAGGSAKVIFNSWQKFLPVIKVIPLELAGHGTRMSEPFHDSIEAVIADIMATIAPSLSTEPYAIFGHSMGSLLAYELTKAISTAGLPPPLTLYVSGRRPPHNCPSLRNMHRMSDDLLLQEMKNMGGTPQGFFAVKELVNAFLPVFRNDYRNIELYQCAMPIHATSADIVFFHSDGDKAVAGPEVNEWQQYTTATFTRKNFSGGHFFINDNREEICNIISNTENFIVDRCQMGA